jgi:predicted dithiol-disulfide oxidoreductase (DUF899 family)
MTLPDIVDRPTWLAAREALLAREKELTRRADELNAERRRLPMVRIEADYRFEGADGTVRLRDLFKGRRQLAVYHFMFAPDWEAACPGCTAVIDEVAPGLLAHLAARDTAFAVVSRAPLAKLEEHRAARGWPVGWYSSAGTDFNADFGVTLDGGREVSALSFFLRDGDGDGDAVFHTYTTYARGTEPLIGAYRILDLSPLGRQERWEQPADRNESPGPPDPSFGGGLR